MENNLTFYWNCSFLTVYYVLIFLSWSLMRVVLLHLQFSVFIVEICCLRKHRNDKNGEIYEDFFKQDKFPKKIWNYCSISMKNILRILFFLLIILWNWLKMSIVSEKRRRRQKINQNSLLDHKKYQRRHKIFCGMDGLLWTDLHFNVCQAKDFSSP